MHDSSQWRWAIGGSVLLVLGVVAAIVYLYAAQPRTDHTSVVTLLLGLTSTTVVALLALLKTMDNARELEANTTATNTTAHAVSELANGSMDAKIRLAVAEVLAPHLVDPTIHAQLEADQHTADDLSQLQRQLRNRLEEGERRAREW
jgi:hypothetical protein